MLLAADQAADDSRRQLCRGWPAPTLQTYDRQEELAVPAHSCGKPVPGRDDCGGAAGHIWLLSRLVKLYPFLCTDRWFRHMQSASCHAALAIQGCMRLIRNMRRAFQLIGAASQPCLRLERRVTVLSLSSAQSACRSSGGKKNHNDTSHSSSPCRGISSSKRISAGAGALLESREVRDLDEQDTNRLVGLDPQLLQWDGHFDAICAVENQRAEPM